MEMDSIQDDLGIEEIASHVLDRLLCTDRTVSEQARLMPSMFLPGKVCKLTDGQRMPLMPFFARKLERFSRQIRRHIWVSFCP